MSSGPSGVVCATPVQPPWNREARDFWRIGLQSLTSSLGFSSHAVALVAQAIRHSRNPPQPPRTAFWAQGDFQRLRSTLRLSGLRRTRHETRARASTAFGTQPAGKTHKQEIPGDRAARKSNSRENTSTRTNAFSPSTGDRFSGKLRPTFAGWMRKNLLFISNSPTSPRTGREGIRTQTFPR